MTRDEYYLDIASAVSEKSPCLKKHYGAVIVSNGEIIATGYNGPPRGEPHCVECLKGDISRGKDYDEYLTCRSVHAEMNAIISAARKDMIGSTLYLACTMGVGGNAEMGPTVWLEIGDPEPCKICERLIKNAGISRVITRKGVIYENTNH